MAAALAACGRRREPARDEPVPSALESDLAIYNWSDYISEETIAEFEREFGVRVSYDTYESNEDLIAKLQAGASGYDLVVPSNYAVRVLDALGLLSTIDRSLLPNWGNLLPDFLAQPFDPDNRWSVPWQWGMTGLAVRSDLVPTRPVSWGVFLDPSLRGRMTQLDDMRDVIGSWLRYRGRSLNATEAVALDQARTDALAAMANVTTATSSSRCGRASRDARAGSPSTSARRRSPRICAISRAASCSRARGGSTRRSASVRTS